MLTATKKFTFEYAHFLPDYPGKCKDIHGHTGILEVTVIRTVDFVSEYGKTHNMVMDFSDLKKIVEENVLEHLDHKLINDIMTYPTAEEIIEWIAAKLLKILPHALHKLRLYETPTSFVEWVRR